MVNSYWQTVTFPIGWMLRPFSDFLTPLERRFGLQDDKEYQLCGVRWYGNGVFVREIKYGRDVKLKSRNLIRTGDVIYNKLFAWRGSLAIVDSDTDGGCVSDEFPLYQLDDTLVLPEFLRYYFRTNTVRQDSEQLSRGVSAASRFRLHERDFLNLHLPIPPLDEQRRIVARIEALAGRIRDAEILQHETLDESMALWEAMAAKVFSKYDSTPRKSIGDFCEVRGGLQKSPSRAPRDHPTPYLTVAHVQRNWIDLSIGLRYFEIQPAELERWRLLPGDVLIIEGNGSMEQIGRAAIFRGEVENCAHQNHVIRARPDSNIALSEYLNAYLNSPVGREEVQKRSHTTSGLLSLSVGKIREIEIPIPPLDEQQRIIAVLEKKQKMVDELQRVQRSSQLELAALLPTVLNKAFRGEL